MRYERLDRMLDAVKPSRRQEEAMLKRLLREERTKDDMKTKRRIPRMAAAVLAAAILTTSAFAAVAAGLDRRLLQYFGAEPGQTPLLSPAAVAVGQERKDKGVTVRLEQALADRYSAVVLLDLTAPEGTALDGDYYELGGRLRATGADGAEMDCFGAGWTLLEDETPGDGRISLLLTVQSINGAFNFLGSKLFLDFEGLYDSVQQENPLSDGRWSYAVTLPREDPGRFAAPDVPIAIGGGEVTLHSLYVSPISLAWELRDGRDGMGAVSAYIHDETQWQEQLTLNTAEGVSLPVGERDFLYTTYGGGGGRYCFRLNTVMDPAQVASVTLFGQTFSLEG